MSLYVESKSIEEEAKQTLNSVPKQDHDKSMKMYYKKMAESAECYRDANSMRYKIYMDYIKVRFRQ